MDGKFAQVVNSEEYLRGKIKQPLQSCKFLIRTFKEQQCKFYAKSLSHGFEG